jgi:hypothetical protein
MRQPGRPSRIPFAALLLALALPTGCADSPALSPEELAALSRNGGEITVTSTDPAGAPQDTTLEVKVYGSNFDQSARVELALGGQTTERVRTNSTRYVNQKQLIASISIQADAAVGAYDVVVLSNIRKGGIGTEMFEVRQKGGQIVNPTATVTYYDVAPGSTGGMLAGDGRLADGSTRPAGSTGSVYDHGQCNVTAEIFENRVGDATMDPIGTKGRSKACRTTAARSLSVRFGEALAGSPISSPVVGGHFTNVREVLALGGVGASGERLFTLLLRGTHPCERLRYDDIERFGIRGSRIRVTRIRSRAAGDADDAWLAESRPNAAGQHVAFCQVGGTGAIGDLYDPGEIRGVHDVPFRIEVVRK